MRLFKNISGNINEKLQSLFQMKVTIFITNNKILTKIQNKMDRKCWWLILNNPSLNNLVRINVRSLDDIN